MQKEVVVQENLFNEQKDVFGLTKPNNSVFEEQEVGTTRRREGYEPVEQELFESDSRQPASLGHNDIPKDLFVTKDAPVDLFGSDYVVKPERDIFEQSKNDPFAENSAVDPFAEHAEDTDIFGGGRKEKNPFGEDELPSQNEQLDFL